MQKDDYRMKQVSIFLGGLLLLTGCGYYESSGSKPHAPSPEQLLLEITDNERFISVDEVADRLVNQDPSLILVDVRSPDQHKAFSLPGAENIPLADILSAKEQARLNGQKHDIVFFSNGTIEAEQAWMLCRRMACPNTYIMRGGLREWADKILNPQEPPATASAQEFERYRLRRAACQYFTGASRALAPEPYVQPVADRPAPKTIVPKPKPKVKKEEEGC